MTTGTTRALEVKGTKISFRFIGRMKRTDFMKITRFMKPGKEEGSVELSVDMNSKIELSEEVVKFLPQYIADLKVVTADGENVTKEAFFEEIWYAEAVSEVMMEFLKYSLPRPDEVKNS